MRSLQGQVYFKPHNMTNSVVFVVLISSRRLIFVVWSTNKYLIVVLHLFCHNAPAATGWSANQKKGSDYFLNNTPSGQLYPTCGFKQVNGRWSVRAEMSRQMVGVSGAAGLQGPGWVQEWWIPLLPVRFLQMQVPPGGASTSPLQVVKPSQGIQDHQGALCLSSLTTRVAHRIKSTLPSPLLPDLMEFNWDWWGLQTRAQHVMVRWVLGRNMYQEQHDSGSFGKINGGNMFCLSLSWRESHQADYPVFGASTPGGG